MSEQAKQREQQERQRQREHQREHNRQNGANSTEKEPIRGSFEFEAQEKKVKQTSKAKPKLETIKVTEEIPGKNGEKNLRVEWEDMPLPEQNAISVYFIITSKACNIINATVQQATFKRSYSEASKVETCYMPVAPHGTKGQIKITDEMTGEFKSVEWEWQSISGFSIWKLIKAIFSMFTSKDK